MVVAGKPPPPPNYHLARIIQPWALISPGAWTLAGASRSFGVLARGQLPILAEALLHYYDDKFPALRRSPARRGAWRAKRLRQGRTLGQASALRGQLASFSVASGGSFRFVLAPRDADCLKSLARRGARVVEWDGLENRCTGNRTVGSNPTLSVQCR